MVHFHGRKCRQSIKFQGINMSKLTGIHFKLDRYHIYINYIQLEYQTTRD
jgi:hypothetical protein